jgi:hypothetical protein
LAKERATAAKVRPPHFCILEPERFPASRMSHWASGQSRGRSAMRGKQTKFQPERIMGELCLGVAVAGAETLVVMGLVLAFA